MSAFAEQALQVAFSPDPLLRGWVPLGFWLSPAGKIKFCFCPTLGP